MSSGSIKKLSDLPDDWWQRQSTCQVLADWFEHYLVGLFLLVDVEGQIQCCVYTGFLLNYEGVLLWVTAGHVINEIRDVLSNPKCRIQEMRWIDNYQVPGAENIPVHNRNLNMFSSSEWDIDFGVVIMTGLDKGNLLKNPDLEIMTEQGWKNLHLAKPEGYYVVGYPSELGEHEQKKLSNNQVMHTYRANIVCLPVSRLDYQDLPNFGAVFWDDPEGFYGRILPFADGTQDQFEDVRGMSGGPLFSIERDPTGRIRYRLFGIQRSQHPDHDKCLIRVEPIHKIVKLMDS